MANDNDGFAQCRIYETLNLIAAWMDGAVIRPQENVLGLMS